MQDHEIEYFENKYGADPIQVDGRIKIPYKWHVGAAASQFFRILRDEKKLKGLKCSSCSKVFMPPRETCVFCFTTNDTWVDVSTQGKIISHTGTIGLIRLDGSDTDLCHHLESSDVKIGDRVEAVFSDKRKGHILDIKAFKRI